MFNFSSYFLKTTFSDLIIKVNGEKLYTHKIILAVRSPYFQLLFANKTEKFSELSVENISSQAVKCILRYMYTGENLIPKDKILDGIILANQYLLNDLKLILTERIKSTISLKNIVVVLNAANTYNISQLKEISYSFIQKHISEMVESDVLNYFSKESLLDIFDNCFNSNTKKKEEVLFRKDVIACLESLKAAEKFDKPNDTTDEPDYGPSKFITTKRRVSSESEGPATRSRTRTHKLKKRSKTADPKPTKRKSSKIRKNSKEKQKTTKDDDTTIAKKPFKISDSTREKKVGIAASSFNDLLYKVRQKFDLGKDLTIALEEDGTEIDDEEYFATLEAETNLMVLERGQKWMPLNRRPQLDVDVVDHPGSSEKSELRELIEKLQNNVCHVSLLESAKLELLADMDLVDFQFFDRAFLENLKEASGRYLSEKRQAQDALDFLKLCQKNTEVIFE